MFNKKNNQAPTNEAASKVDQDLIVHNMPHKSRFGGRVATPAREEEPSQKFINNSTTPKKNVKAVGMLIIGLGVIFIGALIYLSYRFIIKPQAEINTVVPSNQEQVVATTTAQEESPDITANAASSSEVISISEPDVVEVDTEEVASSSKEIVSPEMPEEGLSPEEYVWTPILDTDGDGLTDDEELVLNTNLEQLDTDGDGYLDLAEINSGYDPSGPGILKESQSLTVYNNETVGFNVLYPTSWNRQALNNNYTVVFSAPDNSLFQVSAQDNPKVQSIVSWYEETFPGTTVSYDMLKEGDGWQGIMSEDELNFYLTDSERRNIFVVSYIPVISTRLAYFNIFQLMINSFQLE